MATTITYIVQDQHPSTGKVWKDIGKFDNEALACTAYDKYISDIIWLDNGKRKWRVVKRRTDNTVIKELIP